MSRQSNTSKGDKYEEACLELLKRIAHELVITDIKADQTKLAGVIGKWEPDLIAEQSNGGLVKIECRFKGRGTGAISGEEMGGIQFVLEDVSASGIVISTKPVQELAKNIAKAKNITVIEFIPGITFGDYCAKITESLREWFAVGADDSFGTCDECKLSYLDRDNKPYLPSEDETL